MVSAGMVEEKVVLSLANYHPYRIRLEVVSKVPEHDLILRPWGLDLYHARGICV